MPTSKNATSKLEKAEAEYRHLFESVPVGLFRTKPGIGEILDANPALVNMLGFPNKEALLKRKASSFYVDPNARRKWEQKVAKEDAVMGFETQFRRLDGRLIWVLLSSRAFRNAQGKVIYYEGTIEDITDRRHAQEALAESEERYRLFFENLTDVLLHFDRNLNIIDVSPSIEAHLGYHPDELKGKPYPSIGFLPPELLPQALENTRRLFAGEEVGPHEYPFIAKDGSRVWGEVSSKQVYRNGKIVALYSLVRDIHDRKLTEIELQNTNRDLELYAKLLRHDLINDIQVIFSNTELIEMQIPEDSELRDFLEASRGAADRMIRLLNLLRRPEQEVEKEIVILIDRVAKQAMQTHKQLAIKVNAPKKLKKVRVAGGRLLPVVFVNLFRNAAQHAGAKPEVDVTIAQKADKIQINVADNGPGVPKKLQAKLFERSNTTDGGGLGLNLVKRVLEAYDGSIEFIPKKGKEGAEFRIFLPVEES
ncbi:MAG: PAS domain S-box protein [Promethearchaeota archaeon]